MLLVASVAFAHPATLRLHDGRPERARVELWVDPTRADFHGVLDLDVDLGGPHTSLLVNGKGLTVTAATIGGHPARAKQVDAEALRFRWSGALSGRQTLHVEYAGQAENLDTQGLFRQEERGDWYTISQFEATDARRAFPCFDQPEYKLPWTLVLHAPPGDGAFANAPVVSDTPEPGGHVVTFAPTAPLPSYLVAFAVGPFDVVQGAPAGTVPVRIVAPRGRGPEVAAAAADTGGILTALEAWTGLAYPYGKLDVVAIPNPVGFGAMENPGMVTIQSDLLYGRSAETRRAYRVDMAHELAHQWFGDLVTPTWWTDLWLNESFATWMEVKLSAQLWPGYPTEQDAVEGRSGVMREDALAAAHAIRQPIESYDDLGSAFSGITYGKGAAVLAMVEAYVGPEAFQAGVRAYLRDHANGNATADQFVDAIAAAASVSNVSAIFHDFIDRPGLPVLHVHEDCGSAPAVIVDQARLVGGGRDPSVTWTVPFCFRGDTGSVCAVLQGPSTRIPAPGGARCPAWLVPDSGAHGYFRVDQDLTQAWAAPLTDVERLRTLLDADALVGAGLAEPGPVLELVPSIVAGGNPALVGATIGTVRSLDDHLVPDALRPRYVALIRGAYGPLGEKLGFVPGDADDSATRRLRREVLAVLGDEGAVASVRAQARTLAEGWVSGTAAVDDDLVPVVLQLATIGGDRALFDQLRDAALGEQDRDRRGKLLGALGGFRDPVLETEAMDFALSGKVDLREGFGIFFGQLGQHDSRQVLWDYVRRNIRSIEPKVPFYARGYLPWLGGAFCDDAHRAEVVAFFGKRAPHWLGGQHTLDEALERLDLCVATAARQGPAVQRFLEALPAPPQ